MGKCAIWAPPKQLHAILEGVKFLQAIDPEMFRRLTTARRYVVWYDPKHSLSCRDVFSITDNFLHWGREGVATCLVQNILDFTLLRLPFEKMLGLERENIVAARREVLQRLLKWVSEHSFSEELVKQYEEMVKDSSTLK